MRRRQSSLPRHIESLATELDERFEKPTPIDQSERWEKFSLGCPVCNSGVFSLKHSDHTGQLCCPQCGHAQLVHAQDVHGWSGIDNQIKSPDYHQRMIARTASEDVTTLACENCNNRQFFAAILLQFTPQFDEDCFEQRWWNDIYDQIVGSGVCTKCSSLALWFHFECTK